MVDQLRAFAAEVTRVAREVGTEGRLGGQASVEGVSGVWKDLTDNVNFMATSLTEQVRNIAQVTTAVATGDLSKKVTVDVKGEVLELKNTINTMVDQLSLVRRRGHARRARGRHRGQARRPGEGQGRQRHVEGPDRLRERPGSNLTDQVRNIAEVTTAVAKGDLSQKITVDARGEILQLKNTINTMVDQLSSFAGEVTRVAREVGTEGMLGGQAKVEGVSGVWKDLTDNFNQLADVAHHAGARDRGRVDRGDPGRPDASDHRRGEGRGRRAEGQRQPDDREPPRDDRAQRRAGLAQLEPRALQRHDAGPARPADGLAADHVRADAARRRRLRRVLPRRGRGARRRAVAAADLELRLQDSARRSRTASSSARRSSARRRSSGSRS